MTDPEFEMFFNKYIDQIPKNNFMRPIYEDIVNKYSFKEVLDVGCGNGMFGKYFKTIRGVKLSGVDGSDYALKKAKESGYDNVCKTNDFSKDKLPYSDGCFDFVLCKDVFEHLVSPLHLFSEIIRVLKKDGYFLLHVPNHFPLYSRLKFIFSLNIDTHSYFKDSNEWNFPHIRFFTFKGLINTICAENRMELIKNYSKYFTVYFPGTSRIKPLRLIQENFASMNPTLFSEGITLLFKNTGGRSECD